MAGTVEQHPVLPGIWPLGAGLVQRTAVPNVGAGPLYSSASTIEIFLLSHINTENEKDSLSWQQRWII